jgi:hypothetical protein
MCTLTVTVEEGPVSAGYEVIGAYTCRVISTQERSFARGVRKETHAVTLAPNALLRTWRRGFFGVSDASSRRCTCAS